MTVVACRVITERDVIQFRFEDQAEQGREDLAYSWHRAYFCRVCGNVWARWIIEGAAEYLPISRSCPAHRSYASERPGSLVFDHRFDLAVLPPELLLREFWLNENQPEDLAP